MQDSFIEPSSDEDPRIYRQLVEGTSVPLLVFEKRFLYANPAAEKLTGYSLAELRELAPDDLFVAEAEVLDSWTSSNRPVYKLLCRGAQRRVDLRTSPIEFNGSRALQATVHEIAPAEAERALRMLVKAFETTQLGVTITDPDGKILFTNQAEAAMHGYAVDELLGRDVRVFSPPELRRPMSRDKLLHLHRLRRETVNRHRDGQTFPVHLLSDVVTDENGEPIAVVTICEDITLRKKVEQTLRMLGKAVETTQLGVTITDTDGKVLFTNLAEAEMHGYTVEEIVGRDVRLLAPPELARPLSRQDLLRLRSRRRTSVNLHKDGRIFPVHLASDIVTDDAGDPIAVVTICEDLTAQHRADEERAALESQLRQAQKMEAVGQLAGGVAHDFNNLLVVITGHVEMALNQLENDSPVRYHLTQTREAADKAAGVTGQLLAFSRRQEIRPTDLELCAVVRGMLDILHHSLGENIELRFDACRETCLVRVDAGQIEQVIINLCLNARDAILGQGRIAVRVDAVELDPGFCDKSSWAREGRYVRLTVRDDGCGMDGETLSHIFEPFFTTKEEGKGTGLGLSTVYGIIEQHDGLLHVESQLGQGTGVEIYLPRFDGDAVRRHAAPTTDEVPVARGRHEAVLVAEDDVRVRQVVVNALEKAGYTVLKARDGAEAVKVFAANSQRVSLVLMDLVMPVMSGQTARSRILDIRPQTRFLLTTGYATDSGDLSQLRGVPLILKPYSYETLLKKVREVLDR